MTTTTTPSTTPPKEEKIENPNKSYYIRLDQETIARGYTVSAFEDEIKLSLVPDILDQATGVDIIQIYEKLPLPWQLDKISNIYQFEFRNKKAYDNHKPFYIQFSYLEPSDTYKQVYFFDKNHKTWRPLPTRDFPSEKFVRSRIHLPFARIAVFSNPHVMTEGHASWYAYKGGNFTASPDFPRGSKLRIYNLDERNEAKYDAFVDVTVNDYGPDRTLHPDRVIDLDKIAFNRIASLGAGTVRVRVEPIYIPEQNNRILGIPTTGAELTPTINAKSALLINNDTGEILFKKNPTTTLPIASLTKLVAAQVFLDTNPDLEARITYQDADAEENYKYCNKWEVAKLKISANEEISIEDLLYASLIGSTNNTVETLVRASQIPRDTFIARMNEFASSTGASSTHFIEPTGLAPENLSSSYDYYFIMKEILKNNIISKISATPNHKITIYKNEESRTRLIRNTNKIIPQNKFHTIISKTGYLDEAGFCLAMSAKNKNNEDLIAIILNNTDRDENFLEMEDLFNYGLRFDEWV